MAEERRVGQDALHGSRRSYAPGSSRFASVGWVSDALGAVASTSIDAGLGGTSRCSDAGVQHREIDTTGPLRFAFKP